MTKGKGIHDKTLDLLVGRLEKGNRYKFLRSKVYYYERGLQGEVDVFTQIKSPHKKSNTRKAWVHFYEVKSNYNKRNYYKAVKQYKRFCKAHPWFSSKGIMVTPQKVVRLYENGNNRFR